MKIARIDYKYLSKEYKNRVSYFSNIWKSI